MHSERQLLPYVILASAQKELREILVYLVDDLNAPKSASAFLDSFLQEVERARRFPESFPLSTMPELARRGYRAILVGSYIVLYQYRDGKIVIAHLFHQRRDYAKLVIGR